MSFTFSTKAKTLAKLQGELTTARIASLYSFTIEKWEASKQKCLQNVKDTIGSGPWIVRSSCSREDNDQTSNAGAYLSLTNIDEAKLPSAVEQVIDSYGEAEAEDEVLVQPMLTNVIRSGVAFSHDPNTCAPYRIVNWTEGENTSFVTSGQGGRVWQQAACSPLSSNSIFTPIISLVEELLKLFEGKPIDCEFAVSIEEDKEVLWLLQVRQLLLFDEPESDISQAARLENIKCKLERGMQSHPFLVGRRTVYGVMPDWNPAEIIGVRPKPLALSLYRDLVTDAIWAYQRHNYGYRNLRSFPLMSHFYGLPYIDVRLSFNSFIPNDLNEGLAGRLVDYYIERLLEEPTLHDKMEFEIVFSCYTLDLPERLERLKKLGFSDGERDAIKNSLRKLTNRIIHPKEGLWRLDESKIHSLNSRREELVASCSDPIERIYWLIEDCKRYGTLPFAGLARAGFVAIQMLKSLVATGVFSQDDYDSFMGSVSTISGQLTRDRENLDKVTFLSRYGHLRPGTYDILSPRYDEDPDLYFDWSRRPIPAKTHKNAFSLTLPQMQYLVKLLETHDLISDPVGLLEFMQAGIELRESAKFHFTRNLSDALTLIAEVGANYGFSRDDMAYCDILALKELHIAASEPKDVLSRSIELGKARYDTTLKTSLPPLITSANDVWGFEWPESTPNFITQNQVTALVVGCNNHEQLSGAIVCIPNADPGFDWLFSHPIAGLVTAWGGANSHMAIRAGEMGLPAVIGTGETLYARWSAARRLHLDCAGRRVEILE
ncbi:MAG: PEP-utilizing enzyme [Gammaproteobacteria bacterium]